LAEIDGLLVLVGSGQGFGRQDHDASIGGSDKFVNKCTLVQSARNTCQGFNTIDGSLGISGDKG
jgi:hypothetical protein